MIDILDLMRQDMEQVVVSIVTDNARRREWFLLEDERRAELERLEHERRKARLEQRIAEAKARAVFAEAATADFLAWLQERREQAQWRVVGS